MTRPPLPNPCRVYTFAGFNEYFTEEQMYAYAEQAVAADLGMLQAESFKLAAGVCPMGFGDDGGTPRCCAEAEIKRLQAENEALRREVRYLRFYGDRDCTALADEAREVRELEDDDQKEQKP